MSQVTEQSVRFQTALASIKLIQASAVLDLTEDDFDFLTSNKVWIATDRSPARRCVEACVDRKSGSAGMPRPISYAVFSLKKKERGGYPPARTLPVPHFPPPPRTPSPLQQPLSPPQPP